MAVTITQSPQAITPSDNPVVWVFSSDQAAQDNFSFLIEVYVNGAITPRSTHQVFPEVNGDTAHFDAEGERITTVICSNTVPSLSTFSQDAANNATIYIKIIEYYGTPAVAHADETSDTVRVFKAALSDDNFSDYLYTDYAQTNSLESKLFLTLFPRTQRMVVQPDTERLFLVAMTTNHTRVLKITLYDAAGATVATADEALTTGEITIMDVSPKSIVANTAITLANFVASSYYEVSIYGTEMVPLKHSEILQIDIADGCDLLDTKRLHFLNSIGGIDAFSFTKSNETSRDITRNGMEKQWGGFDSNNLFTFNKNQGREIDYMTQSSGKMRVSSDYITQQVQNWLADEMYESTYVLLEVTGPELKRMKITNTQSSPDKASRGQLIQAFVDLNTSDNRKSSTI